MIQKSINKQFVVFSFLLSLQEKFELSMRKIVCD